MMDSLEKLFEVFISLIILLIGFSPLLQLQTGIDISKIINSIIEFLKTASVFGCRY
jgi:hypothetical protein